MARETLEELRERLLRQRSVQQMIQVRAYEIYQMRGGKPGGEAQDWFHAEGEVLAFLIARESAQADEQAEKGFTETASTPSVSPEPPAAKKTKPRTRSKPVDAKQAATRKAPKRTSAKKPPESKAKPRRTSKRTKAEESQ